MEFKKCVRCGSFFISSNSVCCNCETKDQADIYKVSNYIEENSKINSIQDLSINTGISINNLNRFIENDAISNLDIKL